MAPITKRQLLSLYSKFHDPLGLFTPVSVRARMNMHEIYGSQVGWDELVRPSDMQNFLDWRQALSSLNLTIPRAIDNSEIFLFCDSSGTGWGSVALGAAVDISDLSTEAVAPNSTAPLFPLRGTGGIYGASSSAAWSTPKKELYAVFRGCQLLEEIMNAAANLEPDRERRWVIITDSAISVFRLKSADSKLKMSDLERRWVTYIRATCARFNWRVTHVRSELNVADIPSRGVIGQTHRLLGSVTLSEARVMVGSSSLVEFSPVIGDNIGRLALEKDCPKSVEDIAATGYPPDLAQCFAIGQDNVVDDGSTPLDTSQYQMEALRDHQQKSLLCKEISHYLAQVKGGAQSDDFKRYQQWTRMGP
ncbi:hypothetical protein Pmar_PMAR019234 [Perkinsus marinus ATCC 50983]|uniref:Uncharacterized protein n=1 Tax=Perkinsus marinus (strain ATCC 50983 / TXsc) TaxID=423536 RepID=C5KU85_PERM5|nr:hypothetical protein Pmar_PMAR019234 [Perkinsus marinus ATCC 50983]EER12127.1 hypothetical protein Pmar_PMAR019234 [Perkinsus marinus ATCC 50983]|eukprot:XP_002780332.1 hypothetical protein Pmar_PMAR019234 [Perkinsus marinus ATCC 50983]